MLPMLPFVVDPAWYERHWYGPPHSRWHLAIGGALLLAIIALVAVMLIADAGNEIAVS